MARSDRLIRVGDAGALLVVVGLVSGPTWLLVAVGGAVAASNVVPDKVMSGIQMSLTGDQIQVFVTADVVAAGDKPPLLSCVWT